MSSRQLPLQMSEILFDARRKPFWTFVMLGCVPARRAGWAELGLGSLHSGQSRRTSSGEAASPSPPPLAHAAFFRGPASSLHIYSMRLFSTTIKSAAYGSNKRLYHGYYHFEAFAYGAVTSHFNISNRFRMLVGWQTAVHSSSVWSFCLSFSIFLSSLRRVLSLFSVPVVSSFFSSPISRTREYSSWFVMPKKQVFKSN